jgi:hypothetical protein
MIEAQHRITRRGALHLLGSAMVAVPVIAAAPISALLPTATLASSTGLVAMAEEWFAVRSAMESGRDEAEFERLYARSVELDHQFIDAKANTPAEAVASLEVARADFVQFHFGGVAYSDDGDTGDKMVLAAMDNALRVLRQLLQGA